MTARAVTPGSAAWEFPTLASSVAERGARDEPRARRPLVAVFEHGLDTPEALAVVSTATVATIARDGRTLTVAGDDDVVPSDAGEPPLEALLTLIRRVDADILLVSEALELTAESVDGLQAALAIDSACTTASLAGSSGWAVEGLPPPGTDAPTAGVVLVRREDALFAADEAELTGDFLRETRPRAGDGIVTMLLRLVQRPGFVHREYGWGESPRLARLDTSTRRRSPSPAIVLDASCLEWSLAGTQVQTLGLVGGLLRAGADIVLTRPHELHPTVVSEVARLGDELRFVDRSDLTRPQIFHRPSQFWSLDELADRLTIGDRLVLTHQDMIWDRTPAYHEGGAGVDYRAATAGALASADQVGFFSRHAAIDAASEGRLELDRATVVPLGVDHLSGREPRADPVRPLAGRPYLLMVGSSFWHKNRLFAARLLGWLVERHGWEGGLVLIGGNPGATSSMPAEELFRSRHPSLAGRVADLGHVVEAEQLALYRDAELVLFPSLYEGFGFIPFEAAAMGTACLYSRRSSMCDLLPSVGEFPSLDLEEAGPFALRALESPGFRAEIVDALAEVAAGLTWDRTAAGYLAVYERALARPPRGVGRELLSLLAPRERVLQSRSEAVLLDIYRRRPAFRLATDSFVRVGRAGAGLSRKLRRGGKS